MRVLLVCEQAPGRDAVTGDGSSLISREILLHGSRKAEFHLIYFGDSDARPDEDLLACCSEVTRLPRRGSSRDIRFLLSRLPRKSWRHNGGAARRAVAEASRHADVTVLHGGEILPLFSSVHGPLVVQEVDPWSDYMRQLAKGRGRARGLVARRMAGRMARLERRASRRADAFTLVNEHDRHRHAARLACPVVAIPNGSPSATHVLTTGPGTATVGFVGTLDYAPNVEAALRLVDIVGELRRGPCGDARLLLAGRRPTDAVLAAVREKPWIELVPNFRELTDVLSRIDVFACPDQPGFGTRNSPLEALRYGVPVVAFPSAVRGLSPEAHLVVVSSDQDFLAQTARLLEPEANRRARPVAPIPGRDWADVVDEYLDLYRWAAGTTDASSASGREAAPLR
jgi:glycosyltransferase involved in cell wall biosynthesis